jgi:acyl dehydratase
MSIGLDELRQQVGGIRQPSSWIRISQGMIDAFAETTFDRKFIHVDPARAAETPFGGTVAHGFLTLSLLGRMAEETLPVLRGRLMVVNYGFERVRFVEPVRPGDAVRALFKLLDVSERAQGQWMLRHIVTVEIKDKDRPALTAEWLTLSLMAAHDTEERKTA